MKWFFGVLLLLLLALALDLGLLAYAMYALLAVMLVSRMLTRGWIEKLSASRDCNQFIAEIGETVAVVVTVRNAWSLPVPWVLLEDLLPRGALLQNPPNLGVKGARMRLAMVPRRGKFTFLYQLQCNQRGYYQIGPLMMESGDLFGLHRRHRVATQPHFLLVYPKVVPLDGYDVSSRRPIGEVCLTHRLYEDPTRIAGVRAYQAGDPLSRVHWKATARTGVLHSKIYEPSTVAGATLLLDFHQAAFPKRHEPVRSELAVTAAASVANAVYEMGQQIGLVSSGRDAADRIRQEGWRLEYRNRREAREDSSMRSISERLQPVVVPTTRGAETLQRIFETLARLEITDGLTLSQLAAECESRLPRDATIMAIISDATPEAAITLGNLRRRGYAVTALVNLYEDHDYAQAAGRLLAQGVHAHHLKDEEAVAGICRVLALP